MISEHILKKPLRSTKKHKRSTIIAVAGVERGVGATHLVLMLGHYLLRQRYRVALVECNSSGDYARIEQAYEGCDELLMTSKFRAKGIDYYKSMTLKQLGKVYMDPYDVVILDIGHVLHDYREELVRADRTFLVGVYSDWKCWLYKEFVSRQRELLTNRCRLLINFGDEEASRALRKASGNECVSIPCITDPFVKSKEGGQFLDKIVGDL